MKKTGQIEFRIEKLVKRKGDKLTAEWKNHYNLFNSWTDLKNIVIGNELFS